MSLSRRKLLRAGAVSAFGTFLAACGQATRPATPVSSPPAVNPPVARPPAGHREIAALTLSDFQGQVGTSFRVVSVRGSPDLELVAVKNLSVHAAPARGKPLVTSGEVFALTFVGGSSATMKQDVYELQHGRLVGGSLLLVPSGAREDGRQQYQALINHQTG